MRIRFGAGISRKMFAAAGDSLISHPVVKRTGVAHDLLDGFPVTPSTKRVVGAIVERNIEDGTKIEIESKNAEQTTGNIAVSPDQIQIVLVAQLLRVWWLAADQSQTRNAAAFLIDGDDWLDLAQIAQIVDQFSQLRSALNVAPEKNESA